MLSTYAISPFPYFSLNQVDWENEMECFETFAAAMADFYAMHPPFLPNPNGDEHSQTYYVGKSKQTLNTGKILYLWSASRHFTQKTLSAILLGCIEILCFSL